MSILQHLIMVPVRSEFQLPMLILLCFVNYVRLKGNLQESKGLVSFIHDMTVFYHVFRIEFVRGQVSGQVCPFSHFTSHTTIATQRCASGPVRPLRGPWKLGRFQDQLNGPTASLRGVIGSSNMFFSLILMENIFC